MRKPAGLSRIIERPREIEDRVLETPLPVPLRQIVGLTLAPIDGQQSAWAYARRDGAICRFNAATGDAQELCRVDLPPSDPAYERSENGKWHGPRLHVSASGRFAAIVHDYGNYADVYDLRSGTRTITLRETTDHAWAVPFPFAFLEHDERTVAIHRTAWNRLDVSDAETGEVLSRQPHESDYNHGRLAASPDGRKLLDDGWVWHPYGLPTVWSLDAWLGSKASVGTTRLELACRGYYWDKGMCWLGDDRVAIAGIGEDEDDIVDGARIFSCDHELASVGARGQKWARELGAFAGPSGSFFSDGERLFSTTAQRLEVWDVETGTLTTTIHEFKPALQHSGARELAEITAKTLRRWRY